MKETRGCRYQCLECAYTYNPEKGDPSQGIGPGTPFERLPETWRCPECHVSIRKRGVFRCRNRASPESRSSS
jgi:rubredoxin